MLILERCLYMLTNMLSNAKAVWCNSRAIWPSGMLTFGQSTGGPGATQQAALALPFGTA